MKRITVEADCESLDVRVSLSKEPRIVLQILLPNVVNDRFEEILGCVLLSAEEAERLSQHLCNATEWAKLVQASSEELLKNLGKEWQESVITDPLGRRKGADRD